ncbi:hypothetical protein [Synechococcus sp. MIT S9507]|uniref:hypothetical protein n=1 Tax=Synechococcus sp. MIT S9507 TaxID=3082544 RepID=UPI0039B49320
MGVLPPGLLHDNSPFGELHCRAQVITPRGAGEVLVNNSAPVASPGSAQHEASHSKAPEQ